LPVCLQTFEKVFIFYIYENLVSR